MNKILLISILALLGCSPAKPTEFELDEEIVFSEESNWLVNLDSLKTIDKFILTYRKLQINGSNPIKPFIKTAEGKKISLRELRPMVGRGYVWDCRAHFSVTISSSGTFLYDWNTGKSCNQDEVINIQKNLSSMEELKNEMLLFFMTNSKLDLQQEPDQSDLEIWITPRNDQLIPCQAVIETAAKAYQEFQKSSNNKAIPFFVVIRPKQDKERLKRIVEKEKQLLP